MSKNPLAFPWFSREALQVGQSGMTLRDWFAGQIVPHLINDANGFMRSREDIAELSYSLADVLIEQREK